MILNIETATKYCSVALSQGSEVLFERVSLEGPNHASVLGVFVDEADRFARESGFSIDAVAVSSGPGSYTGLRIGVSLAKGYAYGKQIPLIAIDTLKIIAAGLLKKESLSVDALISPMIDARRMEVYQALYSSDLEELKEVSADIIDESSYQEWLAKGSIYFVGDGASKCSSVIRHSNAHFVEMIVPMAKDMATLSAKAFDERQFVDVAYFQPFYLKEFVATVAKNKVF